MFHLTGGPGASNLLYWPHDKILEKRDVVLVGYRGVDGMVRLDCADFFDPPSGKTLFDPETTAAMREKMKKCVNELQEQGVDLDGYTMLEVIEDVEAGLELRQIIGEIEQHVRPLFSSALTRELHSQHAPFAPRVTP